jgi:tRNA nucleotidyltransferase/poly(A) polymerase
MHWEPHQSAFHDLFAMLHRLAEPVYLVGGAVRDYLLYRRSSNSEVDIVLDQPVIPVARRIADQLRCSFFPLDEVRDVARLIFVDHQGEAAVCDIARLRGGSIEADLMARDFTVNAMAFSLSPSGHVELIDISGGRADLQARLLRRVSAMSLADDYVRMLRAVRLATQLDFEIEAETRAQIQRLAGSVRLSSPERIRDEMWKILAAPTPIRALDELNRLDLIMHVLPELVATHGVAQSAPHYQDVYGHSMTTLACMAHMRSWIAGKPPSAEWPGGQALGQALAPWRFKLRHLYSQHVAGGRLRVDWLMWHALLHDIGKATTQTQEAADGSGAEPRYRFFGHEDAGSLLAGERLEAFHFSRQEINLATTVIRHHMRPHHLHLSFAGTRISRRALYRFYRDIDGKHSNQAAAVDVVLLALADYQAMHRSIPSEWPDYLQHATELLAFAFDDTGGIAARPKPLVDGRMIMKYLNVRPGKHVGEILDYILEAQVSGEVTTPEGALQLASKWVRQHGK